MSTFNEKSTQISNADATPPVRSDGFLAGGKLSSAIGSCATGGSADGSGSTYRLCRVPSSARITRVEYQSDAMGGSAAVDIGVYWPTTIPAGAGLSPANDAAVISQALFGSALSVVSAVKPTECTNESGNYTIAKQEQPLWQAAGLTADPGIDLDVVATSTADFAASGSLGIKVYYQK